MEVSSEELAVFSPRTRPMPIERATTFRDVPNLSLIFPFQLSYRFFDTNLCPPTTLCSHYRVRRFVGRTMAARIDLFPFNVLDFWLSFYRTFVCNNLRELGKRDTRHRSPEIWDFARGVV